MTFPLTNSMISKEKSRWASANDIRTLLESYILSTDIDDQKILNLKNKDIVWLMDAINLYNLRRSDLAIQIGKTNLKKSQ